MAKKYITLMLLVLNLIHISLGAVGQTHCEHRITQEKKEAFSADGDLSVHIEVGNITIQPSCTDEIHVIAHKYAKTLDELDKIALKIDIDKNKAAITAKHIKKNLQGSVDLVIKVPVNTKLAKVVTHVGDIAISDMNNNIWTKSFVGNIALNNINGPVEKAKVNSGNIDITMRVGSHNAIKTRILNGNITIFNAQSSIIACGNNGSIKIHQKQLHATDNINAQISNGDITLYLAPAINAYVDLRTNVGSIDMPLKLDNVEQQGSNCMVHTKVLGQRGSGGGNIKAQTQYGTIKLKELT